MKKQYLTQIVAEVVKHFQPNPHLATWQSVRSVCFDAMIEHYGKIVCSSYKTWSVVDDLAESVLDHLGLND